MAGNSAPSVVPAKPAGLPHPSIGSLPTAKQGGFSYYKNKIVAISTSFVLFPI